jgi:hypothetical protein
MTFVCYSQAHFDSASLDESHCGRSAVNAPFMYGVNLIATVYANTELSMLLAHETRHTPPQPTCGGAATPAPQTVEFIHMKHWRLNRIPIRCAPIGYNIATLRVNVSRFSIMSIGDFAFLPLDQTMTVSATRQLI